MPNTSSESSQPIARFTAVEATKHTTPDAAPITMEPIGPTDPEAGVMATSPAIGRRGCATLPA